MTLWQNLPSAVCLTPSYMIYTQKNFWVEKGSEKKYILKRRYIHHPIYEVFKFYFIGQDSDWQTMESILWWV